MSEPGGPVGGGGPGLPRVLRFPGPRRCAHRPRVARAGLSGVLFLSHSFERLSQLRIKRTGALLVQTHPLCHCTVGEAEASAGKGPVQGQKVTPGILGLQLGQGRQAL